MVGLNHKRFPRHSDLAGTTAFHRRRKPPPHHRQIARAPDRDPIMLVMPAAAPMFRCQTDKLEAVPMVGTIPSLDRLLPIAGGALSWVASTSLFDLLNLLQSRVDPPSLAVVGDL